MMHWTTTKPDKPGWYWFKFPNYTEPIIIKLFWDEFVRRHQVTQELCSDRGYLSTLHGEWAGPIEEPQEPHHG